jgi:hypothetical protein
MTSRPCEQRCDVSPQNTCDPEVGAPDALVRTPCRRPLRRPRPGDLASQGIGGRRSQGGARCACWQRPMPKDGLGVHFGPRTSRILARAFGTARDPDLSAAIDRPPGQASPAPEVTTGTSVGPRDGRPTGGVMAVWGGESTERHSCLSSRWVRRAAAEDAVAHYVGAQRCRDDGVQSWAGVSAGVPSLLGSPRRRHGATSDWTAGAPG